MTNFTKYNKINIYKNNINLIFALKMKESMNLLIENKGRRLKALLVKIDIETHWSKLIKWKVLNNKNTTFKLGWHRGLYIRPCI